MDMKKRLKTWYLILKNGKTTEKKSDVNLWSLINCLPGKTAIFLFSILFFTPAVSFAACTVNGASVVYVNGVFTSVAEARDDLNKLRTEYQNKTNDHSVDFFNGYNPSHLAGLGDIAQAAAQM